MDTAAFNTICKMLEENVTYYNFIILRICERSVFRDFEMLQECCNLSALHKTNIGVLLCNLVGGFLRIFSWTVLLVNVIQMVKLLILKSTLECSFQLSIWIWQIKMELTHSFSFLYGLIPTNSLEVQEMYIVHRQ